MKKKIKADRNHIHMNYPSSWWGAKWREALPSGNGAMGAAVYGGVNHERILLTHGDLWWKSQTPPLPDVSDKLSEVRTLLNENKPFEANNILVNTLTERGYTPVAAVPLPLGDMNIMMPNHRAFKNYRRSLDMEKGEVSVSWYEGETRFTRQCFVSRPDNLIVCRISSSESESIKATISVDRHDENDAPHGSNEDYFPPLNEILWENNTLGYSCRNDDGTDFGAVTRVICSGGTLDFKENRVEISGAQEILLIMRLFIKGTYQEQWDIIKKELSEIKFSYEELLQRHGKIQSSLMNSMALDLKAQGHDKSNEELLMEAYKGDMPTALLEKMWSYGRYLLISSSREGGQPCHLYGLWCGEYQPMWAFNMANENIQMIYWHALSGNLSELLMAVFDYYDRMMEDFRENARKLYGCRGIFIPAPTTPDSGLMKDVQAHLIHWTGAAGWLAQHYYDYYLHTGDKSFLETRALPFMKEAALFYEDFFILDEKDHYISSPSNSPENTPGNYWKGYGRYLQMETTMNATMDFAIAKELLTNLIWGSKELGLYEEEVDKWQDMLTRIPDYEINQDGAVKEWLHPFFKDNYHHRHESHLYPVFPGLEVTRESNPLLFQAFEKAVEKRLVIGLKQQSGWSLAHMANNYARMGHGNQALECLELMSRSCVQNNLYTTHNDWRDMGIGLEMAKAPIQLDANMGWCSAVNEMLMFSIPGMIKIMPALPEKWTAGRVERLLARGGIEVSLEWNEKNLQIELLSPLSGHVELLMPEFVLNIQDESPVIKPVKVDLVKNQRIKLLFHLCSKENRELNKQEY